MIGSIKETVEYLQFFWQHRKTKWGLMVGCLPILGIWIKFICPFFETDKYLFYSLTFALSLLSIVVFFYWVISSGRIVISTKSFTVAFCIKSKNPKGNNYVENTISHIKIELDKIGILEKIRFISLGNDVLSNKKEAHCYSEKNELDLVIWGEVFCGNNGESEACDFRHLFYTYKIPHKIIENKLIEIFKTDVNISLVSRDWNIYEINSNPDTEKISCNLTEIIFFILGIIYLQEREYAEDSIVILESLFKKLESKTREESFQVDQNAKTMSMSADMFRKGRVLAILTNVYKNIGNDFVQKNNFKKGYYYLEKYIFYQKPDVNVLSALALCMFNLGDVKKAIKFTDDIHKIDKSNPIYLFNKGFFGIYEKNYASSLYFYKELSKHKAIKDYSIITKVIAFLDNMKSTNRNEFAYDFAIGFVNVLFCQQKLGIVELRKFIKAAKKKQEYAEMVSYAQEIIGSKKKIKSRRKVNR